MIPQPILLPTEKAQGKVIAILGIRGIGKTTFIQNLVKHLITYLNPIEPDHYYSHTLPIPIIIHGPKSSISEYSGLPVRKSWIDYNPKNFYNIVNRYKHAFVVIEDLVGLYKSSSSREDFLILLNNFLCLARKEDRKNTFIIVTHTFGSLEKEIWNQIDSIIIFKNEISTIKFYPTIQHTEFRALDYLITNLPPYHYVMIDKRNRRITQPTLNTDLTPIISFLYDIPYNSIPINEIARHTIKNRIMEYLQTNPNTSIEELCEKLNINVSTARTYISILKKENKISYLSPSSCVTDRIMLELQNGKSIEEIIAELNREGIYPSPATVRRALRIFHINRVTPSI